MWGTDMTQTVTLAEGVAHVFVAVDHCNSECVGIHADKSANRFQALEPVRQGVRQHFGAIGKDVAAGLTLRHDHGPNYMSDDFQDEIAFLGIEASPSFVRQPEGNGVAERFIRTLKENLLWVQRFETIEELRHCSSSPTATTPIGCSPVMATEHPLRSGPTRSGPTSDRPWIRPHERSSRLSHNRGAVQGRFSPIAALSSSSTGRDLSNLSADCASSPPKEHAH